MERVRQRREWAFHTHGLFCVCVVGRETDRQTDAGTIDTDRETDRVKESTRNLRKGEGEIRKS